MLYIAYMYICFKPLTTSGSNYAISAYPTNVMSLNPTQGRCTQYNIM
jgi:hypothetical protein